VFCDDGEEGCREGFLQEPEPVPSLASHMCVALLFFSKRAGLFFNLHLYFLSKLRNVTPQRGNFNKLQRNQMFP
jgi:hypothetical protein